MMQEEEAKEKAFLEKLAQKLKDGGVSPVNGVIYKCLPYHGRELCHFLYKLAL